MKIVDTKIKIQIIGRENKEQLYHRKENFGYDIGAFLRLTEIVFSSYFTFYQGDPSYFR